MKRKNAIKEPLSNYMYWPLLLTVLIIALNIPLYYISKKAGFCVSIFAVIYFVVELGLYLLYRSSVRKEAINFATQYGTVQKKLLKKEILATWKFKGRCRAFGRRCTENIL